MSNYFGIVNEYFQKKLIYLYENYYELKRMLILRIKYHFYIMDYEKTIQYILNNKCIIARFGDGEFDHILDIKDEKFQKRNKEL